MRRNRSILGPIVLITIGVLFAMEHVWGMWSFWRTTWPVVLIVIGLVKLLERIGFETYDPAPPPPRPWGPPGPPLTPPIVTPPPPPGTVSPNAEDNYHAS